MGDSAFEIIEWSFRIQDPKYATHYSRGIAVIDFEQIYPTNWSENIEIENFKRKYDVMRDFACGITKEIKACFKTAFTLREGLSRLETRTKESYTLVKKVKW